MIEVKNIISFVHQGFLLLLYLSGLLLFCSSNKANYKGKKLKLVERDPLKPFLLQNGTKESTKGMDRP